MFAKGSVSSELPWLILSGLVVLAALAGDARLLWAAIRTRGGLRARLGFAVAIVAVSCVGFVALFAFSLAWAYTDCAPSGDCL